MSTFPVSTMSLPVHRGAVPYGHWFGPVYRNQKNSCGKITHPSTDLSTISCHDSRSSKATYVSEIKEIVVHRYKNEIDTKTK